MKVIEVFIILFLICASLGAKCATADVSLKKESALAKAYHDYKNGDLKAARSIVDAHYSKGNLGFSLLSGMMYADSGDCKKALKAIDYVSSYYDTHQRDITSSKHLSTKYLILKRVSIKCNMALKRWGKVAEQENIYRQYVSGDQLTNALGILGNAYMEASKQNVKNSIETYNKTLRRLRGHDDAHVRDYCLFKLAGVYTVTGQKNLLSRAQLRC